MNLILSDNLLNNYVRVNNILSNKKKNYCTFEKWSWVSKIQRYELFVKLKQFFMIFIGLTLLQKMRL